MPLREINLNVEVTSSTDIQQQKVREVANDYQVNIPDLNISLPGVLDKEFVQDHVSPDDVRRRIFTDIFGEESDENVNEDNQNIASLPAQNHKSRKRLSDQNRYAIYNMLQQKSVDGKLKRDATTIVASSFYVPIRTVQCIWKQGKDSENYDVSNKVRNCGRKRIEFDLDKIRQVPFQQRTTLRSLSASISVSTTTLHRHLKSGDIRRHSNSIKPFLKEENKQARLRFCLSNLDASSIPNDPIFVGMYNIVHIDEKWFYMTRKSERYYLLPNEEDPLRTCKSKNFIGKVMFLVAVARPRFDAQKNEIFSGKIGVFPFVTQERAKRNSVNRLAGTMETKPITSVTRDVIKSFLINKVLPTIREKWPRDEIHNSIYIQHDNAKTHISLDDVEFREAATRDGFDIRLICQPPNSPDLNVLDLGFLQLFNPCNTNNHQIMSVN